MTQPLPHTYVVKTLDFKSTAETLATRLKATGCACTVAYRPNNLDLGEHVILTTLEDAMGAYYSLNDLLNELNSEEN